LIQEEAEPMSRIFFELEILYNRLGYTVQANASSLSVNKRAAGLTSNMVFYALQSGDQEEVLMLAEKIASSGRAKENIAVIYDSIILKDEFQLFLKDYTTHVLSLPEWLNEVINSKLICEKILEKKFPFYNSFVEPIITPVPLSDLLSWSLGNESPDESLGHVVLLLGPAGFGKTTITHYIAKTCAEKHLQDSQRPVPIYITLEDFRSERKWDELLSAYSRSLNIPEITPAALKYFIDKERAFVIVDGLDELAERGGVSAATETLRQFVELTDSGKLLITARQSYVHQFKKEIKQDELIYLLVSGTDPKKRLDLIPNASDDTKKKVTEILDASDTQVSNLSSNPILIVLLADILSDEEYEANEIDDLVQSAKQSPALLFDKVFEKLHERELKRQGLKIKATDYQVLLGDLALEAIKFGVGSSNESNLIVPEGIEYIGVWIEDLLRATLTVFDESVKTNHQKRILDSIKSHPLLEIVYDGGKERIKFVHPIFRDCLASSLLGNSINNYKDLGPISVGEGITNYVSQILAKKDVDHLLTTGERVRPYFSFLILASNIRLLSSDQFKSNKDLIDSGLINPDWRGVSLERLELKRIEFCGVDFSGTVMRGTVFISCRFIDCQFDSALVDGTLFEHCTATENSVKVLLSHGVKDVPATLVVENGHQKIALPYSQEFAKEVLRSFFHKFIRTEPGKHKRSTKIPAFSRGLEPEKANFTSEYLIPLAQKYGLVQEISHIQVLRFNGDFQNAGDRLVFENELSNDLEPFYSELVEQVERYLN
jgi:hypothetical protein